MRRFLWWVVLGAVACGGDDARIDAIMALDGDVINGEALYAQRCADCHGDDGTGGSAEGIVGEEGGRELIEVILLGEESMPGFEDSLNDQEIADIAAFVETGIQ